MNRARVNYHSSGERDAQKRSARAVARKRTKGIVNDGRDMGGGGVEWTGWRHPADLVNGEPEASKLTPIRHTYEKAFRLVVRTDLCQLRREAAATNFTRVPSENAKAWRRWWWWRWWWRSEERDAPVDIHKLAKLRELRFCSKSLLEGASASASRTAMVLGNLAEYFCFYSMTVNGSAVYIWKTIRDRKMLQKIVINLEF